MSQSKPKFPITLAGGQLMPFMDARARADMARTVMEMLGGAERLYHESNRDPESYKWFVEKVWAKGLPRAIATEHSVNAESVEDLYKRLDAAENARVINGEASHVHDTSVVDVTPEEDS